MGLEYRLRLEAAASEFSPRRACACCGATSAEAERLVLAPIDLDDGDRPPPGPDTCSTCGRRLVVRLGAITLDDAG